MPARRNQRCPPFRALNSAVECHLHTVEVAGSNPAAPTMESTTYSLVLWFIGSICSNNCFGCCNRFLSPSRSPTSHTWSRPSPGHCPAAPACTRAPSASTPQFENCAKSWETPPKIRTTSKPFLAGATDSSVPSTPFSPTKRFQTPPRSFLFQFREGSQGARHSSQAWLCARQLGFVGSVSAAAPATCYEIHPAHQRRQHRKHRGNRRKPVLLQPASVGACRAGRRKRRRYRRRTGRNGDCRGLRHFTRWHESAPVVSPPNRLLACRYPCRLVSFHCRWRRQMRPLMVARHEISDIAWSPDSGHIRLTMNVVGDPLDRRGTSIQCYRAGGAPTGSAAGGGHPIGSSTFFLPTATITLVVTLAVSSRFGLSTSAILFSGGFQAAQCN